MLTYNLIDQEYYNIHSNSLKISIDNIWSNINDSKKAINAILSSFTTEKDSFHYTIETNNEIIGITGFYALKNNTKLVGLNHHGILKKYRGKGLGKSSILDLIGIIKDTYSDNIDGIIEIVPEGSNEIEKIFKNMGFKKLTSKEIKKIETIDELLKKGYYETAYILKI